ncbi:MAG: C_GCAxxG_C_C family protein [Spirochaetia bacterium]|nr:C_GCAxxG_C_C family protein [Spirochaetia bacterium]
MEQYYIERALELREKGYNCAQAVACAFIGLLDINEETLFKITAGFGGGMGGNEGTCGAISGGITVLSLLLSEKVVSKKGKEATYKASTTLFEEFVTLNKSGVCKDLKGTETGIELRSCEGCIIDATRITYSIITS